MTAFCIKELSVFYLISSIKVCFPFSLFKNARGRYKSKKGLSNHPQILGETGGHSDVKAIFSYSMDIEEVLKRWSARVQPGWTSLGRVQHTLQ